MFWVTNWFKRLLHACLPCCLLDDKLWDIACMRPYNVHIIYLLHWMLNENFAHLLVELLVVIPSHEHHTHTERATRTHTTSYILYSIVLLVWYYMRAQPYTNIHQPATRQRSHQAATHQPQHTSTRTYSTTCCTYILLARTPRAGECYY